METEEVKASYRFSLLDPDHRRNLEWLTCQTEIQDIVAFIAEGGQGAVFQALFKLPNKAANQAVFEENRSLKVALKTTIIPDRHYQANQHKLKNAMREVTNINRIMERNLPYMVKFYAAKDNRNNPTDTTYRSYIVMEMASTNLRDLISKSVHMRAELCYQACKGLHSLHQLRIFHRDIKPQNFLAVRIKGNQERYESRLTDFGCSRQLTDTENIYGMISQTIVGTAFYLAPEVKYHEQLNHNFAAQDVYSFCLSLLVILYGIPEHVAYSANIISEAHKPSMKRDLTAQMFERKPGSNLGITMPKIPKAKELLACIFKGLRYDSSKRMGNLSELLSILETYVGSQNNKCRFSHDKYYDEVMCVADNSKVQNIDALLWENELMKAAIDNHPSELFGVAVMQASVKTGLVSTNCVLKLGKARTASERQSMWRYIQMCKQLQQIHDSKLVKIYDVPRIYRFPLQPKGDNVDTNQIKDASRLNQGECLLAFVFMEAGKHSLGFNNEARLKALEQKMLPEDDYNASPELKELKEERTRLRRNNHQLNVELQKLTLKNRLYLCYRILQTIEFCHKRDLFIGAISLPNVMLFLTDTTYTPKIVKLERFLSKCLPQHKLVDLKMFLEFFDGLVMRLLPEPKKRYRTDLSDAEVIQKLRQVHSYLVRQLNKPQFQENFMAEIIKWFAYFKQFEPITYANCPLQECTASFPDLKRRIKQVTPLAGWGAVDYQVMFESGGSVHPAHMQVFDLKQVEEFNRKVIINAVHVINLIKGARFKGFLEYYEAVYRADSNFVYIVSEDYVTNCANIEELRKSNQIRPDELIGNFKDILISLKHLHGMGISHMNIVPENFYIVGRQQITIKLGGFEFALTEPMPTQLLFRHMSILEDKNNKRFKPPEYLLQHYPLGPTVRARFASDVWMFGTSLVMFATGEKSLPHIKQLDEFNKNPQQKSSESNVRNESLMGKHVETMRKSLLRLDWNARSGPNFIENFMVTTLNYRTIGVNAKTDITQTLEYLQNLTEVMDKLANVLEYVFISQKVHFRGFVGLIVSQEYPIVKEDDPNAEFVDRLRSIFSQYYMKHVNIWMYMLSYLQIYCLKQCLGLCEKGSKTINESFSEPVKEARHKLNAALNRSGNYHAFIEESEPGLTTISREKERAEIFKIFKDRLMIMFMLFRRYILETHEYFTSEDTMLLQGICMSYTVEDYLHLYMQNRSSRITSYSELQKMSFGRLVQKVRRMAEAEQQLWMGSARSLP